ncbi:MAG TPA: class I SAM-dependent methyltransferase [Pirellulaceae bacterium]|jgi:SAM-dependent methyltransferase
MSDFDRDKWNAKYAAMDAPREPSAVLVALEKHLPRAGRAIEIAGGGGRNSIWLARRGLDVTLTDISPVGLEIARQRAEQASVVIQAVAIDLEQQPLPGGPFDLIVSVCYLCRHLFPQFSSLLADDGRLVVIQPTKRNLQRSDKPPADYLFEEGELRGLAAGLEIVHYEEGWSADDRYDAVLVAKKRAASVV